MVLVRFQTKRMMKSQRTMMRQEVSSYLVVVLHRVIHERAEYFGNQMPNLVPVLVVFHCQICPLEVVRQLAYGWQFVLQQRSGQLTELCTWFQPCPSDLIDWLPM